ncbi:MAG: YihA family ribosome biogenesis GTP-binding protein [Alphaproteobacteria bacterium RIFOXYD12_FULL_60_8]|nr:MAG: YihA family ribosome biogenesis GTP-binding protein [Alphaproteobacteria bacterium RIFOXYD12_FULL_60_8]
MTASGPSCSGEEPDNPEALEAGRKLFAGRCDFLMGVVELAQLPESGLPEVAFAGRSNVGKSSLINALTGRKALARTSNTPGRTQEINFFNLSERLMLVDLPGYGFAEAPKDVVARWRGLVFDYLRGRPNLRRACVLIDARHGLKTSDREVMKMLDEAAVNYQVVLTKADKIKDRELEARQEAIRIELGADFIAAHPVVLATSSEKGTGIAELRAALAALSEG